MRHLFALLCMMMPLVAGAASLLDAVCEGNDAIDSALSNGASVEETDAQGQSALHRLFRCGTEAADPSFHHATRKLLDAGVPLGEIDNQGRSALHATLENIAGQDAAVNLYVDGARLMLARGMPATLADPGGVTPLHLAAAEPKGVVTQLLLDLGADINAEDEQGYTPLWYAAAADDNLNTFALLLARARAEDDAALLEQLALQSAQQGHTGKLNLLLQKLPTFTLESELATRALAQSLWQGAPLPVLERLTNAGADAASLQTTEPRDLAWRLAMLDKPAELDWLLKNGWDLSRLPASGYPSLYFADANATKLLLAAGANPQQRGDGTGTVLVPLNQAEADYPPADSIRSEARSDLLLKAGYRPQNDAAGHSDLWLAIMTDDLWLTRALLARSDSAPDFNKLIPAALKQGRLPVLQALLREAANTENLVSIWLPDYLLTPDPAPVLVESLLVGGLDANARQANGEPALLLAARRQLWPMVSLLLKYGADPLATNAQGCSLRCYEWSMPEALQQQLTPKSEMTWVWPAVNQRPSAFFALALVPLLGIWLLTLAWRLAQRKSLWSASGWLILASTTAVLLGGALFYQCAPCVMDNSEWQIALTALVGVLVYGLFAGAAIAQGMRERY